VDDFLLQPPPSPRLSFHSPATADSSSPLPRDASSPRAQASCPATACTASLFPIHPRAPAVIVCLQRALEGSCLAALAGVSMALGLMSLAQSRKNDYNQMSSLGKGIVVKARMDRFSGIGVY
jgi:hypothetical protein